MLTVDVDIAHIVCNIMRDIGSYELFDSLPAYIEYPTGSTSLHAREARYYQHIFEPLRSSTMDVWRRRLPEASRR